jgi:hypothetical protein
MIERMFYYVHGSGSPNKHLRRPKIAAAGTQQDRDRRRLRAVETDPRSLTAVLTRTAAMLLIAVLLILVLLPAVLAASGR